MTKTTDKEANDESIAAKAHKMALIMSTAPLAGYIAVLVPEAPDLLRDLANEIERLQKELKGAEAERDAALEQYERQFS